MTLLAESVEVLQRSPVTLRTLLAGLPRAWTTFRDAESSWTTYEVVGHLVHGERTDWLPRLRIILESGPEQPFPPFDREGMRGEVDDLDTLLENFAGLRAQSLEAVAELGLTEADLHRTGTHPGLGPVRLGELLASWVVHDLSHIAQVAETMAKRYRGEIGPWRAYLPVVDRPELDD